MLMTPIWPKMMARPRAMRSKTQKVLRPLKACIAQIEKETFMGAPKPSLISLGERVRLDQLRFVDHLVLPAGLGLTDAKLAPEVMIGVDLHVALRRGRELDSRRRGHHLVHVE